MTGIFDSTDAFLAFLTRVADHLGTDWTVERQHEHGHHLVGPGDVRIFVRDMQMSYSRVADRGVLEASISYSHLAGVSNVYPSPKSAKLRFTASRGAIPLAKAITRQLLATAEAETQRVKRAREDDVTAQQQRQEIVDIVRRVGMVTGKVTRVVNDVEGNRAEVDLRSQNDTDAPSADVVISNWGGTMKVTLDGPTDKVLAALKVLYANGVDVDELYGAHLS